MIARVSTFFRQHPMLKGMAVYSVIWPTSSVVQQVMSKEELDWRKSLRFFLFGTFFVAPSLYGWVRLSSSMWPQTSFKVGVTKAVVEAFSYGPAASVSFFTLMTLMEGRGFDAACMEVREKFLPTLKGKNLKVAKVQKFQTLSTFSRALLLAVRADRQLLLHQGTKSSSVRRHGFVSLDHFPRLHEAARREGDARRSLGVASEPNDAVLGFRQTSVGLAAAEINSAKSLPSTKERFSILWLSASSVADVHVGFILNWL